VKNLEIKRVIKITADLTADQWQLYDTAARNHAAHTLNCMLMDVVNSDNSKEQCRNTMHVWFRRLSHHGANDSEPNRLLEEILDQIFLE
jgi:hypothetical protein